MALPLWSTALNLNKQTNPQTKNKIKATTGLGTTTNSPKLYKPNKQNFQHIKIMKYHKKYEYVLHVICAHVQTRYCK